MEVYMRILVTNDDGIEAPGIELLAAAARKLGEVTVLAPREQCSAMSQHITLGPPMELRQVKNYPVSGVKAYSLCATPADCVRSAFHGLFPKGEEPELVLSGINDGPNCGFDIQYSATIGAAKEAVTYGVPAICFSLEKGPSREIAERYVGEIARELVKKPLGPGKIWNVNFPSCPFSGYKGILYDREPAQHAFYEDVYVKKPRPDGGWDVTIDMNPVTYGDEGSDIRAVIDGYTSIGIVMNSAMLRGLREDSGSGFLRQ